jgi:hypothetical protein
MEFPFDQFRRLVERWKDAVDACSPPPSVKPWRCAIAAVPVAVAPRLGAATPTT